MHQCRLIFRVCSFDVGFFSGCTNESDQNLSSGRNLLGSKTCCRQNLADSIYNLSKSFGEASNLVPVKTQGVASNNLKAQNIMAVNS